MPMLEIKNREYQTKIETAITEAIMRASLTEDGKTAVLLSGEIVQAGLNVIAMAAGTSNVMRSPTTARHFADECAKSIRARSAEIRRKYEAGEMPFMNIIHAEDRH